MKLCEIVSARGSLQKLISQDLPLSTAFELMQLTEKCNVYLKFYGNEIAKFNPESNQKKLDELDNMVVCDVVREKIKIRISNELKLSAADVKYLLPFIDFVEGE